MSKSAKLQMYKMLDEDNASILNFLYEECSASYCEEGTGKWKPLNLSAGGTSAENMYFIDGGDDWDPETCAIKLKQIITLEGLKELFQTDENPAPLVPVALADDVLGITAVWWSDESKLRGCKPIGEIRYDEIDFAGSNKYELELEFQPGQLGGRLEVFYTLCMIEPGERMLPGFAHDKGVLLGDVGTSLILQVDGEGAAFPIVTVEEPNGNLWWTEINIDDPFEDSFTEENFCLVLNSKHPDYDDLYKDLRRKSGTFSSLYYEVFASALEELFIVIQKDFGSQFDSVDIKELLPGSIAYAVIYMIKTFEIKMDGDITNLHNSIRKAVFRQLKETSNI